MINLRKNLSFGFEQTFTISNWWEEPGFIATSDTPLKREKMLQLTKAIVEVQGGHFIESLDIWNHLQYETFLPDKTASFIVTMDPGSIEVKTPPVLFDQIEKMAEPLFIAAEKAEVLPYRNWWYGVKGGTEGGCHINFGGLTKESNPLIQDPTLVVKYAAYIHNRPFLHYPFMGIDVGKGGNAMRMDEKNDFDEVQKAFKTFNQRLLKEEYFSVQEVYDHFKETNLINEKSSFPSLYKFTEELNLIEDRAQEALRSAKELELVSEIRLKILEELQTKDSIEDLSNFNLSLHNEQLTSYYLWSEFQLWANSMSINPLSYQCFFERQFPKLWMGENPPTQFGLKEGRRERVIKEIIKRGDTIISKTIDTNFKRFEVYFYTEEDSSSCDFLIEAIGVEQESTLLKSHGYLGLEKSGNAFYKFFDIQMDPKKPEIKISMINTEDQSVIDKGTFDLKSMTWK